MRIRPRDKIVHNVTKTFQQIPLNPEVPDLFSWLSSKVGCTVAKLCSQPSSYAL